MEEIFYSSEIYTLVISSKSLIRIIKRYFKIDQHLAQHFVYNVETLSMQSNNHPFSKFNDHHQSGKRVGISANC